MAEMIPARGYEITAALLIGLGLLNLILQRNLIKKSLGINLFSTGIYLLFGTRGFVDGGTPPIVDPESLSLAEPVTNLIPTGLILTGIVVSVSVTAFFLAVALRIYGAYGTLNVDEIAAGHVQRTKAEPES